MQPFRTLAILFLALATLSPALPARAEPPRFKPLETLMEGAVRDSVFPGASIAVLSKGRIVFHKAFGRMTYSPSSTPADTSTIYDLASLTKAIATTSIIMQLVERDSLSLGSAVSSLLPGFRGKGKEKVTIEHLLCHTSGLRAHTFYAKSCRTPEELFQAIEREPLLSEPGSKTLYSDLGFMLLGKIIETRTRKRLDENFHARFSLSLGLKETMFTPPPETLGRIAPVDRDTSWPFSTPRPLVNDQNAALLGGVAGHAGLYSTTGDLARMVMMVMNGGTLDAKRYFRESTLRRFLSGNGSERALGWDRRPAQGSSSSGKFFSSSSYGHLGYTGTSIWIDPEKELAVILLSNRVYPSAENIKIRAFRPLLHDTIVECMGEEVRQKALSSAQ
ncbi:MAG: serine hydrolase domain-containing protein [Chlorobiaceae bacterium]